MARTARVLLLADTHVGFDWPAQPRIARRRRGPDFLARFEEALTPALRGEADLVVHGGDLLYRARVPAGLVQAAMAPLFRVADRGVPVFLVPGNHERSRIPYPLLTRHRNVFLFDEPRTYACRVGDLRIALAGFPFAHVVDGESFERQVRATRWREQSADVRLLCMHQAVEGATVGAHDYVFRQGVDVVPGGAIPADFAAVLSGHIHRAQVLTHDLAGSRLAAPVLYPGSVERTAFAERNETKGFLRLALRPGPRGGSVDDWRFHPVAARPMLVLELPVEGLAPGAVERRLRARLHDCDPDAVVRIVPQGTPEAPLDAVLSAHNLRRLAPSSMNVSLAWRRAPRRELRHAAR
ncbi:MAG: metallophosphoesterase family protein [Planctomycetota bacterium]|jgi:DNA repair exonuclease SbcCD nuclease subunit